MVETMSKIYFSLTAFCVLVFCGNSSSLLAQADGHRSYWIGNSLTNDLVTEGGFENLASFNSDTFLASQHVQCSTSLTGILDSAMSDPGTDHTCTGTASKAGADYDLGTFPGSFDHQIDTLVFQPFQNATLREEIAASKSIIDALRSNPANVDTRIVIYQTWDLRRSSSDYLDDWYGRTAELDEEFRPSKAAYDALFADLTSSGYEFDVIPAGEAFANASEALLQGPLGNVTDTTDLFRDFIHSSNAGRYLGSLVASEVLTGRSSLNLPDADQLPSFQTSRLGFIADSEASAALRQIAHSTVAGVPEPSVVILLGFAILGCGARRIRQRQDRHGS